jgi:hypothetical protein
MKARQVTNKVRSMVIALFDIMGNYFMKPSDYHDATIRKVLHFIRTLRLTEG